MVFKAGPKLCWQCASYKGHRHLRAVPDMLNTPTPPPPRVQPHRGYAWPSHLFIYSWHSDSIVRTGLWIFGNSLRRWQGLMVGQENHASAGGAWVEASVRGSLGW